MFTFERLMRALQYLNKYFYKYRTKLFLGFLITIIARIFSLVAPRLIGNSLTAVERYISSEKSDFENDIFVISSSLEVIVAPSYKTKIGEFPNCLNSPFFAYVI